LQDYNYFRPENLVMNYRTSMALMSNIKETLTRS
jgi:hypothetical protein